MTTMDKLREWNLSKDITCPSCNHSLFIEDDDVEISCASNNDESPIVAILHKVCSLEKPKPLHFCLTCGARSTDKRSKLKLYCTCHKNEVVPPILDYSRETYESKIVHILSSKNENNYSLDITAIIAILKASQDFPSFDNNNSKSLSEALMFGLAEGTLIVADGKYSLNAKPSLAVFNEDRTSFLKHH